MTRDDDYHRRQEDKHLGCQGGWNVESLVTTPIEFGVNVGARGRNVSALSIVVTSSDFEDEVCFKWGRVVTSQFLDYY